MYTFLRNYINRGKAGDNPNNRNKEVVFKDCAQFTNCISEINTNRLC